MASKRRLRRRSCESKVKHLTQKSAESHARGLGSAYVSYKCPHCSGWHVGRPSSRKRQSTADKKRNYDV